MIIIYHITAKSIFLSFSLLRRSDILTIDILNYKLRKIKIDNYKKKHRIETIMNYFYRIFLINESPIGRTPWLQRIRVP